MGKQAEVWINVHQRRDGSRFMMPWFGDAGSAYSARANLDHRNRTSLYRIHVRLKPEGAPKRYADEEDRWTWETYPHSRRGGVPASIIVEPLRRRLGRWLF